MMVIFAKTEKKLISGQTRKGPYIYEVYMEGGCPPGEGLKNCHISADSFVFKQKIYCSFLGMEGVGGCRTGHFLWLSMYDP